MRSTRRTPPDRGKIAVPADSQKPREETETEAVTSIQLSGVVGLAASARLSRVCPPWVFSPCEGLTRASIPPANSMHSEPSVRGESPMPRKIMLFTALVLATLALMLAGHGDGPAIAGTATPKVAGTWSHRSAGSGQATLRLL